MSVIHTHPAVYYSKYTVNAERKVPTVFSGMSFMGLVGWLIALFFLVVVVILVYVNVRAQRLNRALGSFSSALQIGPEGKWYWGVGQYGASSLLWYKLVSLSPAPVLAVSRYDLALSSARPHGVDADMVEVTVSVGDQSWDMAMDPLTYNGLVAWVESGAPHSTSF